MAKKLDWSYESPPGSASCWIVVASVELIGSDKLSGCCTTAAVSRKQERKERNGSTVREQMKGSK